VHGFACHHFDPKLRFSPRMWGCFLSGCCLPGVAKSTVEIAIEQDENAGMV
jgi:hypothetical protein